jgi:hypothetical protein
MELLPSTAERRATRQSRFRDKSCGRGLQTRSRQANGRQAGNQNPLGLWQPIAIDTPIRKPPYKADRLSSSDQPIANIPGQTTVLTRQVLDDKNATSLRGALGSTADTMDDKRAARLAG